MLHNYKYGTAARGGATKTLPNLSYQGKKKRLKNQFLAQWLLLAVKTHLITVFIIKSIIFTWNPFKKQTLLDPNSCLEKASDDSVPELWTLGVIKPHNQSPEGPATTWAHQGHCRLQPVWHRGNSCSQGHNSMEASRNTFLPNWGFLAFASYSHIHAHKHDGYWMDFCGQKRLNLYTFQTDTSSLYKYTWSAMGEFI